MLCSLHVANQGQNPLTEIGHLLLKMQEAGENEIEAGCL